MARQVRAIKLQKRQKRQRSSAPIKMYRKVGTFQPVHYFKRNVNLNPITVTTGTDATYAGYSFKLNDLHDLSQLTGLYDFFKLTKVVVKFIPIQNVTSGTGSALTFDNAYSNRLFTAIDYNDKSAPTSVAELREYSTCKWTPMMKIHKRVITPQVVMTVDEDGPAGSSYGYAQNTSNPWISTGSNACQYFGLKVAFEHTSSIDSGGYYVCEAKYYMKFKNYK